MLPTLAVFAFVATLIAVMVARDRRDRVFGDLLDGDTFDQEQDAYRETMGGLTKALRARGFTTERDGGRARGERDAVSLDYGFATGDSLIDLEFELSWPHDPCGLELGWETTDELVSLKAGTWRGQVRWSDAFPHELHDALHAVRVRHMKLKQERSVVRVASKTSDIQSREGAHLDAILEVKAQLDAWMERGDAEVLRGFEGLLTHAPDRVCAGYYEEMLARGHMSGAEVLTTLSARTERDHAPFSRVLHEAALEPVLEVLGLDATLELYARRHDEPAWAEASASLRDALSHALEPEDLIDHIKLPAGAVWRLLVAWRARGMWKNDTGDHARLDTTLMACWEKRPTAWRATLLGRLAAHLAEQRTHVALPRLVEVAARASQTCREHVALARLVNKIDGDTLERDDVVDALITQLERTPVGSDHALVDALSRRDLERLPRELLKRMRGADPLSPLAEAAQRLCDPERLRGALTASASVPGGDLAISAVTTGSVTEYE